MADEINVPIKIPTDSSSVSNAKGAVDGLAEGLKGLGPAAAAGAGRAKTELGGLEKAAKGAAQETAKAARYGRDEKGRFLGGPKKGEAKTGADGSVDVSLKTFEAAEKKRLQIASAVRKEMVARDKEAAKHARDTANIQRSFMKGAADKRAADLKEIGSMAMGTVAIVAAVASAAAAISAQFVRALVSVQAFREATLGAYAKLLDGAKQAEAAFKATIATADQIGMSYEEALRGVNSLIAKGFKADQAQDLVKAMADLKSVVPDANIGNLLLAITQIKSKGVLQMEELQGQIAEAGLSVSVVLEEIGKGIGKSGAEVRKLISQGKISADQGVQGILAAIQKTTGKPIGKAAEEASKSLGGLLSRLEQIPQGLLLMADASKGVSSLKDALGNVLSAFAPSTESGKLLSAAIGRLGDAFATFIGGLTGKGGATTMKDFAGSLALAADRVADLVTKIGLVAGPVMTGFIKGFSAASKVLGGKEALDSTAAFESLGAALGKVATAVGFLATLIVGIDTLFGALGQAFEAVGAIGSLADGLSGLWTSIQGWIATAASAVSAASQSIGANLVQGIIAGISLASPALASAVVALAGMTTGTMQGAAKIQSPSKLWRDEIGYQLPAGAAEGVYDGAPLMARAARDVAGSTTVAGAASVGAGMAGGGRSITITIERLIVNAGSGAKSIAEQVRAALQTELEALT
ncbi:MAG: hypothetical protein EKK62_03175 [Acidimicrobiia bacterium]|nr:MAG: hypothetical protein EKK62_03175 [Acidimicrobiia bacterium]